MDFKKQRMGILIVAISLATAWAIRGKFGHEQGAAWAGAIGALALVLVAQRRDWYNKMLLIALASALGWGAGGMISYGQVVGYGRSIDFLNAYYGLGMLFVIGALFGLLGGGLVGLVLDSTKDRRVKWGSLVSEMVAGGLISYFFLIEQIGIKMTPPRSEAWAIILGAGLAMLWYMARENRNSPIRVAIFSALGGGFGFAFGNFLQVMGHAWQIPFNMWNVMEYSIGFFGGTGMAYGVLSSVWPVDDIKPRKWINRAALFIILVFVPFIVFRESMAYDQILKNLGEMPNLERLASESSGLSAIVLLLMAVVLGWRLRKGEYSRKETAYLFYVYFGVYLLMSYVIKGVLGGHLILENHLYVLNIIVIYLLLKKRKIGPVVGTSNEINTKNWIVYLFAIVLFIGLLSLIAINVHGEIPGAHNRF
ncbi:hypothetical protein K8352_06735 [Flavobacteriaceae bacterium F89]|uniref:Uncharacterized protein n=1 Tax=Cerina litoralis TaxID=2874477 RepID=A0AAE3ESK9_9FLAO|nr:hypothetical protein [Cerina litoralis]MCG2460437.1 hypothetical protein [Cerina litoralis]